MNVPILIRFAKMGSCSGKYDADYADQHQRRSFLPRLFSEERIVSNLRIEDFTFVDEEEEEVEEETRPNPWEELPLPPALRTPRRMPKRSPRRTPVRVPVQRRVEPKRAVQRTVLQNIRMDVRGDGLCMWWSIWVYLVLVKGWKFTSLSEWREELKELREMSSGETTDAILALASRSLIEDHFARTSEVDDFIDFGTKPGAFTPDAWRDIFTLMGLRVCVFPDTTTPPDDLERYFQERDFSCYGTGETQVFINRVGNHYNVLLPRDAFDVEKMELSKMKNFDRLFKEMFSGNLSFNPMDAYPHICRVAKKVSDVMVECDILQQIIYLPDDDKYTLEDLRAIANV